MAEAGLRCRSRSDTMATASREQTNAGSDALAEVAASASQISTRGRTTMRLVLAALCLSSAISCQSTSDIAGEFVPEIPRFDVRLEFTSDLGCGRPRQGWVRLDGPNLGFRPNELERFTHECSIADDACSLPARFHTDYELTIISDPVPGTEFRGWTGDCATAGASRQCKLKIAGPVRVLAMFCRR
jgi:hypothetical protein